MKLKVTSAKQSQLCPHPLFNVEKESGRFLLNAFALTAPTLERGVWGTSSTSISIQFYRHAGPQWVGVRVGISDLRFESWGLSAQGEKLGFQVGAQSPAYVFLLGRHFFKTRETFAPL